MSQTYAISSNEIQELAADTFSRYVLESNAIIDRVTHHLKGEVLEPREFTTASGQVTQIPVWVQRYQPLMNEDGVNFIVQIMTFILDKTIASSNLQEFSAKQMMKNSMDSLAYVFYMNLHEKNHYGFSGLMEMECLLDYLNNIIMSQVSRAIGMATLKQLQTNHSVIEQRSYNQPAKERRYEGYEGEQMLAI